MELGKQYLKDQLGSGEKQKNKSQKTELSTSEFLKEAKEFARTKGILYSMST